MAARNTAFGVPHSDGYSEDQTDFYTNTLKPFLDPELLKRFLTMPNRILFKNPEMKDHVKAAFMADDDQSITDTVELLELLRDGDVAAKQTPILAILAHLNLAQELNDIKVSNLGYDASTNRINAVTILGARLLADRVPSDQLEQYQLSIGFLSMQISSNTQLTDNQKQWYLAKLSSVGEAFDSRINIETYLDDLPDKDPQPVSKEIVEADDEEIAKLFTQARAAQKYGVKVGYKQMQYHAGSLVYSDLRDIVDFTEKIKDRMHPLVAPQLDQYLAVVNDSPRTSFDKNIKLNPIKSRYYTGTPDGKGITGLAFNFESRTSMAVSHDGQLFSLMTSRPFATIAAEKGVYHAYRKIQAEILAGYVDLVTPLEIIHKAKKLPVAPLSTSDAPDSGTDIVGRLLIPRIKIVQEDNGTIIDTDEPHREIRLHGVVWHIRQLPPGFQASPQATELAKQAHITLADGETFVRSHTRGNKKVGEVVTHQLITR